MDTKAFKVGKVYTMFSPTMQSCSWTYKVVARTAKTITLEPAGCTTGSVKKCRISTDSRCEYAKPLGRYSMSPTLRAN